MTKQQSIVSTGWKTTFGLGWSSAGEEIWFTGSRENRKPDVYAVTVSGRERLLYQIAAHLRVQDISADGRLLVTQGDGGHSRMMYFSSAAKNERGLKTWDWSRSVDLSPDGTTLLYYEWGTAVNAVPTSFLRKSDDDSAPAVNLGERKALALSPDGRWALALRENTPPQLVLLPTTPAEPKVLPRGTIQEYHHAAWFPDNRQILFTALEPDSLPRSYVQDIDGGEPRPLTEEGIEAIRVSRDGKRLVVLNNFNGRYYFQPLDGSDPVPIKGIKEREDPIQRSDDGRALYVRDHGDFRCNVYRIEVANGRRELWRTINPPDKVGLLGLEAKPGGVLITPDGQSLRLHFLVHDPRSNLGGRPEVRVRPVRDAGVPRLCYRPFISWPAPESLPGELCAKNLPGLKPLEKRQLMPRAMPRGAWVLFPATARI